MRKIRLWSILKLDDFVPEDRLLLIISFIGLFFISVFTAYHFYSCRKIEKEYQRNKEKTEREYQEAKKAISAEEKSTPSSRPCGFSNYYDITEAELYPSIR